MLRTAVVVDLSSKQKPETVTSYCRELSPCAAATSQVKKLHNDKLMQARKLRVCMNGISPVLIFDEMHRLLGVLLRNMSSQSLTSSQHFVTFKMIS